MRLLAQHSVGFDPSTPWIEQEPRPSEGLPGSSTRSRPRGAPPTQSAAHEFTRLLCPEWVNVVAFTAPEAGGELLVVEQFRHGIDAPTFEIVGGVCDPGEDPVLSASRELREETGHRLRALGLPGQLHPEPCGAEQPVPLLPGPGLPVHGSPGAGPLRGAPGLGHALDGMAEDAPDRRHPPCPGAGGLPAALYLGGLGRARSSLGSGPTRLGPSPDSQQTGRPAKPLPC